MEDDITGPAEVPSAFAPQMRPRRITDEDGWLNVVDSELDRLPNPHQITKRRTIIALVQAKLTRTSEDRVWELTDTCSRNTWHRVDKNKNGKPRGWRQDPVISDVYQKVLRAAIQWSEQKPLLAVREAAAILTNAAPEAAEKMVAIMRQADNKRTELAATVEILDRAGMETAPKGTVNVNQKSLNVHAHVGLEDFDIDPAQMSEEEYDMLLRNLLIAGGKGGLLLEATSEYGYDLGDDDLEDDANE